MSKLRLRSVVAALVAVVSLVAGLGASQRPASAANGQLGLANSKVHWSLWVDSPKGRSQCHGTAQNPFEKVLWANRGDNLVGYRRFWCHESASGLPLSGTLSMYLNWRDDGIALVSYRISAFQDDNILCGVADLNSNISGRKRENVVNYDSQIVVEGVSSDNSCYYQGISAGISIDFIEGFRM